MCVAGNLSVRRMRRISDRRFCFLPQCGFTLIELMIVLVIMGFMLTFAGPRVAKSLGGVSLKTSARKIAGALRYARSKAVNTGRTYHAIFDMAKNRMIVVPSSRGSVYDMLDSDNGTFEDEEENSREPVLEGKDNMLQQARIYNLPKSVIFEKVVVGDIESDSGEDDEIYQAAFFPNGTSQSVEIVITDPREQRFIVSVDFITGVVSIAEQLEDE